MQSNIAKVWKNEQAQQLVEALLAIDNAKELQDFLRDVMTEKEIIEISARLQAAKMLQAGQKYTDITKQTKLSSRTVARISDWMQNGTGGYELALNQIGHSHTLPDRAG